MKTFRKVLAFAMMISIVLLCFASCIKTDRARGTIEAFLAAVSAEDYESAEEYLHPDCRVNLKDFFEGLRKEEELDFSAGVEILRYTNVENWAYDSKVGGAAYATTLRAKIGEKEARVTVMLIENKMGYGISDLSFQKNFILSNY